MKASGWAAPFPVQLTFSEFSKICTMRECRILLQSQVWGQRGNPGTLWSWTPRVPRSCRGAGGAGWRRSRRSTAKNFLHAERQPCGGPVALAKWSSHGAGSALFWTCRPAKGVWESGVAAVGGGREEQWSDPRSPRHGCIRIRGLVDRSSTSPELAM